MKDKRHLGIIIKIHLTSLVPGKDFGDRQIFPDNILQTPAIWNSMLGVHVSKALKHPHLIGFFRMESQRLNSCLKFKPHFLCLTFIVKTGEMRLDNKLMAET